uniref:Caspase family p20 domain-containing protein n=1 Tax=Capitella teleta TaxID=283909 RepID=X1YZC9_CAPTE
MQGCYKVTHETRGLAVIINNVDFRGKFDKRDSSGYDVSNMEGLFRELHFEVKKHKDKDAQGIIKCLEDERSNLPESDIFVAVIMSHGSKNCVYGTDGKSVQIEEIIDIFNGTKCPKLKDTPKVFFIQACQGDGRSNQSITNDN